MFAGSYQFGVGLTEYLNSTLQLNYLKRDIQLHRKLFAGAVE